jgi:hypothetical protein
MEWEDTINAPMVRQRQVDLRSVANRRERRTVLPEDQQLLTDQQLRDASDEQLQDLIARVDLLLRSKGQPGLALHPPEDESDTPEPSDPADPGAE